MNPKYPKIKVKLSGEDGNALNVLARVQVALRKANVPADEIRVFAKEAMDGDYNDLLSTCRKWITVL